MDRTGIKKRGKKYAVDTRILGHKVRKGGFKSEADAGTWLYRLRTDREALEDHLRERLDRRSPTVEQVVEFYMEKRGRFVRSADRHEQYIKHLLPEMGRLDASKVRQEHIDSYENVRREQAKQAGRGGDGRKTAHNELCFLRTALLYAWRNDRLPQPPKFKLRKPRSERSRVARPAEAQRLYNEGAEAFDAQYGAICLRRIVMAAWDNGMREGEIIGARRAWLVPATRELVIPWEFHKTGEDGSEKRILLSEELWESVHQEPTHPKFVFCRLRRGRNGKGPVQVVPWTKSTLYKAFVKLRRQVGSPDLWFHDLRRSMSTVGQERGHMANVVQQIGGWKDPMVVQRHYTHAGRDAQEALLADLARLLVGGETDLEPPQASLVDLLQAALKLATKKGSEGLAPPSEQVAALMRAEVGCKGERN